MIMKNVHMAADVFETAAWDGDDAGCVKFWEEFISKYPNVCWGQLNRYCQSGPQFIVYGNINLVEKIRADWNKLN